MPTTDSQRLMRAVWYERKGAAREVLQIGQIAVPEPGLMKCAYVSRSLGSTHPTRKAVERGDWPKDDALPVHRATSGCAGVIDAVGAAVPSSRVGEWVWLYEAQRGRAFGTAAEYVVVPRGNAVRLPDEVSFVNAACLGVPAMTAHRCLFADEPIAGKVILVTGAVGGVGQYAVQLAKWGGATVIATVSSAEKAAQARGAFERTMNERFLPERLTPIDLTGYTQQLQQRAAASTVNVHVCALRSFCTWLEGQEPTESRA